jgi:hypothetical protein
MYYCNENNPDTYYEQQIVHLASMEEIEAGLWATLRANVRDSIQLLGAACQQNVPMHAEGNGTTDYLSYS